MLNDNGEVVRVVQGLAPLSGSRRGEDVMLSDALAFDLRVYDPGAPLFWRARHSRCRQFRSSRRFGTNGPRLGTRAYTSSDNMGSNGKGSIGNNNASAGLSLCRARGVRRPRLRL